MNLVAVYNIIKLHDLSCDEYNLIRTISYHNSSQNWSFINYLSLDLSNLFSQSSESTFWINLCNKLSQSTYIELAALLACGTLFPQTYVHKRVYFYLSSYIWFRWWTFWQITHLLSCGVYHSWALFSDNIDKSSFGCNYDFSLVQMSTLSITILTRMIKPFWCVDQLPSGLVSI